MTTLNILIVENDDTALTNYQDAANEASSSNPKLELHICRSSCEALRALSNEKIVFYGVIIDLNLIENNPSEASGNEVIDEIYEKRRIPVRIVSGNIDNLNSKYKEKDNFFFKTYTRGDGYTNYSLLQEFVSIYNTGIFGIIGGKDLIMETIDKVFWKHLSKDIESWFSIEKDSSKRSLLRYTLNHLSSYLNEKDKLLVEAEFYIKPPVIETIASGDLIKDRNSNQTFISLTPACDLAIRKDGNINAKYIMLAQVTPLKEKNLIESGIVQPGRFTAKEMKNVMSRVLKEKEIKRQFLPQHQEIEAGIIMFDSLKLVSLSEYIDNYSRQATIAESFFKDIQSRFASYIARQGKPDLDKDTIIKTYLKEKFSQ